MYNRFRVTIDSLFSRTVNYQMSDDAVAKPSMITFGSSFEVSINGSNGDYVNFSLAEKKGFKWSNCIKNGITRVTETRRTTMNPIF